MRFRKPSWCRWKVLTGDGFLVLVQASVEVYGQTPRAVDIHRGAEGIPNELSRARQLALNARGSR